MVYEEFSLAPHPASDVPGRMQIRGRIGRRSGTVSMSLELLGSIERIIIPARAEIPMRKNRLWEATCFELFMAPEHSGEYWEVNLSPSGDWNHYHFSGYRQDMEEEKCASGVPSACSITGSTLRLSMEIHTGTILQGRDLKVGVSAVLEHTQCKPTYWALVHCGSKPDFHAPGSFLIHLPGRSAQ